MQRLWGRSRERVYFCVMVTHAEVLLWGALLLAIREEPRATSLSSKHLSLGAFFFLLFSRTKTNPFLGNQSTGVIFPTLGIWFLCIPSSAFNECQHYPMGPTWISLRQLKVAPSDEFGEVNEVTGHILMSNTTQLTVPVSDLHLIEQFILDVCDCTL